MIAQDEVRAAASEDVSDARSRRCWLISRSLSKVHLDIDISLSLLVGISLPLKGSYRYRYLVVVG